MSDYDPWAKPIRDSIAKLVLIPLGLAGLLLMGSPEREYVLSVAPLPVIGPFLLAFFAIYAMPVWLLMPLMKRFSDGMVYDALDEVETIVRLPLLPADGFFYLYRKGRGLVRGEGEDVKNMLTYLVSLILFASLELRILVQAIAILAVLSIICAFMGRFYREADPLEDIKKG